VVREQLFRFLWRSRIRMLIQDSWIRIFLKDSLFTIVIPHRQPRIKHDNLRRFALYRVLSSLLYHFECLTLCVDDTDFMNLLPAEETEHPLTSNFGVNFRPHFYQRPQLTDLQQLQLLHIDVHSQSRTTDFRLLFTGTITQ